MKHDECMERRSRRAATLAVYSGNVTVVEEIRCKRERQYLYSFRDTRENTKDVLWNFKAPK